MRITKKEKLQIHKKSKKLEEVKVNLKKKFIGIDDTIDKVVDTIRPFYIFPKSLKKPIVVSLFGLTGCGKTSLVESLVDELNMNSIFSKYDIGEYSNNTSEFSFRKNITENLENLPNGSAIVCFDEFQLGNTITNGSETPKNSIRLLWDFIDTGKISYTPIVKEIIRFIYSLNYYSSKYNDKCYGGIVTKNWLEFCRSLDDTFCIGDFNYKGNLSSVNVAQILSFVNKSEVEDYNDYYFNDYNVHSYENIDFINSVESCKMIPNSIRGLMINMCPHLFNNGKSSDVFNLDIDKFIDFVNNDFLNAYKKEKVLDFSKSLIFVLGNIDEAYSMSHDIEPDADADIFYNNSLKITVPDVKRALASRFRMEQISRLGNNIIVYPSFSSETYRRLISYYLNQRVEYLYSKFKLRVEFTDGVHKILYSEGVYPSQGVRPLLSSINTLIDSYISVLVSDVAKNYSHIENLIWDIDLDKNEYVITSSDFELRYSVKLELTDLRKTSNSDIQAYIATHEAGHAIASMVKLGIAPTRILSKTANINSGFCQFDYPDFTLYNFAYGELVVLLAGREAERLIFGEECLSIGSYSDLNHVTSKASMMIKLYGLDKDINYQIQNGNTPPTTISSSEQINNSDRKVIELINRAKDDCSKIISDNLDKVLYLANILTEKSSMESDEIKQLANDWNIELKPIDKYYNFKQIIKNKYEKEK